ncbi:L-threonylcarbamoyladenylate synthase [Kouleothrix sp.]|uniref:L-threonylcarbamoyladenylate synthase n=1 Tax=Kouleothrix sp. TaxID=2779161 RepID=UPI00391ABFB2
MPNQPIATVTLVVDAAAPAEDAIQAAAAAIRRGELVAFPTETVYGLGANALDATAVARIFAAKQRPAADPLIVHIAAIEQLALVAAEVPPLALALASAFWPGPLTLVLRRQPIVPPNVSAGRDTVAVRVPAHPVARALCAAAGVPIAAPSANMFTRPSPTEAGHVLEDLSGRIELLLDGGATPIGLESSVLDLTQPQPQLLRPGGLPIEALRQFVPDLEFNPRYVDAHTPEAQAAPGMLLKHYSPRAELRLYAGSAERAGARLLADARQALAAGRRVGALAPDEDAAALRELGVQVVALGPGADLARIGRRIFAGMRALDRAGADLILARGVGRAGLGLAIWDRLVRAAEGRVIDAGD